MPRKISNKKIELMKKLHEEGLSITDISKRAKVCYQTAYNYLSLKERGIGLAGEYYEYLARERGFNSVREYYKDWFEKRGFRSARGYYEHLARERGFNSVREYKEYLDKIKQRKAKNQELSDLIKKRLKEIGKNQNWLANELGVTRQAVSLYALGKSIPSDDLLKELYLAIKIPDQTLDSLLENADKGQ